MSRPRKPLDGIRVLTFEIQVAGPYCTMMLADQGASVVKVENPKGGDTARGGAPKVSNDKGETQSGYFLRFNRNKRSCVLDLKKPEGRDAFMRLVRSYDVLVDQFRPRQRAIFDFARQWGLRLYGCPYLFSVPAKVQDAKVAAAAQPL